MHIEIIGSLWGVALAFECCRCSQTLFNNERFLSVQSKQYKQTTIQQSTNNNHQTYMLISNEQQVLENS